MAQQKVVVVSPPRIDSSRHIKALITALRDRGAAVDVVSNYDHVAATPHGACLVFLYRSLDAVLVEAMTRGMQPTGVVGPWVKEVTELFETMKGRASDAVLVNLDDLELHLGAIVGILIGRAAATETGTKAERLEGRRLAMGDPVLRALVRATLAEFPKARRLNRELTEKGLVAAPDAAVADTAFLYYSGIVRNRDPAAEELSATALTEVTAERDRLRREIVELRGALSTRSGAHAVTVIGLGETFSHPAFYGLEHGASGRVFRWMGRLEEAVIATHLADLPAVQIRVAMEHVIDDEALAGLQIGVNGRYSVRTETTVSEHGQLVKSAVFDAPPPSRSGTLEVWLRQTHVQDLSGRGDARTVGCGIAQISVEPIAPSAAGKTASPPDPSDMLDADPGLSPAPERTLVQEVDAPAATAVKKIIGSELETIVIAVDENFDEPAFYHFERRPDGLPFAWMGKREAQAFTVVIALDRPIRVEAHLAMVIDDEALAALEITFDQAAPQTVDVRRLEGGGAVKTANFPAQDPSRTAPELVQVRLIAGRRVDMSDQGDTRTLSVALHKLVVTRL